MHLREVCKYRSCGHGLDRLEASMKSMFQITGGYMLACLALMNMSCTYILPVPFAVRRDIVLWALKVLLELVLVPTRY